MKELEVMGEKETEHEQKGNTESVIVKNECEWSIIDIVLNILKSHFVRCARVSLCHFSLLLCFSHADPLLPARTHTQRFSVIFKHITCSFCAIAYEFPLFRCIRFTLLLPRLFVPSSRLACTAVFILPFLIFVQMYTKESIWMHLEA